MPGTNRTTDAIFATAAILALVLAGPSAASVSTEQDAASSIRFESIPAQQVLLRDMSGSYEQHPQAIVELHAYAAQQGITAAGPLIGVYPDDPVSTPENELRWQLAIPITQTPEGLTVASPYRIDTLPAIRAGVVDTVIARISQDTERAHSQLFDMGYEHAGPVRMLYVDDNPDVNAMKVRVLIPVRAVSRPIEEATLDDFAFLVGEWHGETGGNRLIERWSAPLGDAMLGAFQWVRPDGSTWMYELLTIQKHEAGITFLLRHFNADFTPWEPADKPMRFDLIALESGRASFERSSEDVEGDSSVANVIFHRVSEEALHILLIPPGGDEAGARRFTFRLAGR